MTGDPETDRRPRWRKTRWRAAGLFWLLASYWASIGPLVYGVRRGWVPVDVYAKAHYPVYTALDLTPFAGLHADYVLWWINLGYRHEEAVPE